jgi:hypothetical protein
MPLDFFAEIPEAKAQRREGVWGGIPPRPSKIFLRSRRRDFPEKRFGFYPKETANLIKNYGQH